MNVKIIETGKFEELTIIDQGTGVNWIDDLLHGHLQRYDEEQAVYMMTQEEFDWWLDLTNDLAAAEERLAGLDHDEDAKWEFIGNCDLEDLPGLIEQFCQTIETA